LSQIILVNPFFSIRIKLKRLCFRIFVYRQQEGIIFFLYPDAGKTTTGDALFAAGDYLYSSYDYGRYWNRMQILPETPPMILYAYPGYLFTGTYQHLYRSTTNGMNWTPLTLPDTLFTPTTICRIQGTFIAHVETAMGSKIYLSEDDGDTWQLPEIPVPTNRISGLHEISGVMYDCTAVGIFRSFDRGDHWEVSNTAM